ncbi:MAG: flippase [Candidatus Thermoplasmatota archaeon]
MKSKSRKFVEDVGLMLTSIITGLVASFLIKLVIGNFFGPVGLGTYAIVITLLGIIGVFFGLGIESGIVKFSAQYKENKEQLNKVLSASLLTYFISGVFMSLFIFIASKQISTLLKMPSISLFLLIVAIVIPLNCINLSLMALLNGLRMMRYYLSFAILRQCTILALSLLLIFFGFGLAGVFIAIALETTLTFIILKYKTRKLFNFDLSGYEKIIKSFLSFTTKIYFAGIVAILATKIDLIFVSYFLTDKDAGIYAASLMCSWFLTIIPRGIQSIVYPAASEFDSKRMHAQVTEMVNRVTKYSLAFLIPVGLIVCYFLKPILLFIFPSKIEFLNAVWPARLLIIGMIFYGTAISISTVYEGSGRPDITMKIAFLVCIISIFLDLLLIPIFGINGAAIATSSTVLVQAILIFALLNRVLSIRINYLIVWKIIISAIFSVIAFIVLRNFIFDYLTATFSILIYFSLLLILKAFTNEDKNLFMRLIR